MTCDRQSLLGVAPPNLFSSSPEAFDEPTHVNVQPPLYWLRIFREHSFGPLATHDPSYLCAGPCCSSGGTAWRPMKNRRPTPSSSICG